jgi:hypothetical protein
MIEMKARVWLGSEKQQSYGILANATLSLHYQGNHIVDLREWKVRNTKNGIAALPPSRNAGPDKQNPGKDRYINYYSIFANQIELYKKAQQIILEEYYTQKGGSETAVSSQTVNTPPAPLINPQAAPTQTASTAPGVSPVPPPIVSSNQQQQSASKPNDAEDWPYGEM